MIDTVDFANAIWYEASSTYQDRIPLATRENIVEVGNALITYTVQKNEFLTALINKIGKTIVNSKMATNSLGFMRGEDLNFGDTIEEIFVELAKSTEFKREAGNPFDIALPSVKVIYHRIDRELQYTVTIRDNDLARAFNNPNGLTVLTTAIVNSLYSGKNLDDFTFTKELFGSYDGYFEVNVTAPTTEATSKSLVKAIKKYSQDLTFMSNKYNKQGVVTSTPLEDQILLLHKDAKVNIDTEYLAGIFNLSKAEMENRIVVVDDFGTSADTYAILVDKTAPRIHKTLETIEDIRNPKGRYTNYFLNSDGVYSLSQFANAVIFKKATPPENG